MSKAEKIQTYVEELIEKGFAPKEIEKFIKAAKRAKCPKGAEFIHFSMDMKIYKIYVADSGDFRAFLCTITREVKDV